MYKTLKIEIEEHEPSLKTRFERRCSNALELLYCIDALPCIVVQIMVTLQTIARQCQ